MGLFSKKSKNVSPSSDRALANLSWDEQRSAIRSMATMGRELADFVELVGEGNYQTHLARVGGAATENGRERRVVLAVVEPEPDNQYDSGAIRVTIDGGMVGYVSRSDQTRVRPLMERALLAGDPATCLANLTGGWDRGGGDVGSIGVELDLRTPAVVEKSRRK